MQSTQPVVELKALRYRYPRSEHLAVSVEAVCIEPAEQLVLTGHSGCGKSTLLHLIAGLMDPTSGTVKVRGTDVHALRGSKRDRFRGQHIGMVFQTFQLLHGFTVIENIFASLMFSELSPSAHRDRAMGLLETLGIDTPDALVQDLSIGQQQRVAVARAVACSPSVVLADEPTAALDPEFSIAAMDLLQEACRSIGAALICVTHDTALIERFGRHERLSHLGLERSQV